MADARVYAATRYGVGVETNGRMVQDKAAVAAGEWSCTNEGSGCRIQLNDSTGKAAGWCELGWVVQR